MDWMTADWHIDHANIIKFCNRPFNNVKQMNEVIVSNVNSLVQPKDTLYVIGDLAFRGANLRLLRDSINCNNVFVVPGNHDKVSQLQPYFNILPQCRMYKGYGIEIVLCHYAMRVWNRSHYGVGHLYGHSHGQLPPIPGAASFDVGVDCWNFFPLSIDQVKAEFDRIVALAPNAKGEDKHHQYEQTHDKAGNFIKGGVHVTD